MITILAGQLAMVMLMMVFLLLLLLMLMVAVDDGDDDVYSDCYTGCWDYDGSG